MMKQDTITDSMKSVRQKAAADIAKKYFFPSVLKIKDLAIDEETKNATRYLERVIASLTNEWSAFYLRFTMPKDERSELMGLEQIDFAISTVKQMMFDISNDYLKNNQDKAHKNKSYLEYFILLNTLLTTAQTIRVLIFNPKD